MSEENDNELSFSFNFARGLGKVKDTLKNGKDTLRNRLEEKRNQDTTEFEQLNALEKMINENTQRMRANRNNLSEIDPLASEVPPFIANHAKEKGKKIEELISSEQETSINKKTEIATEKDTTPKEPIKLLDKKKVRGLGDLLKTRVFGQGNTIDEVVDILTVAALDIKVNADKPAGCYFFAGPSGVGKTELAQSIADQLGVKLLKINMGEYSQEHEVSKLIGAPPGYKGADQGGVLTNFVKENPACVVLFDEIEKADPTMDNILLSIMDHGTCGDNKGNTIAFTQTIVIATSNLGAQVEYYPDLTKEQKDELRMGFIKEGLRPEIINRYDSIFHFNALTPEIYKQVADKFFKKLNANMLEKHGFEVKFTPKLVDFMVEKSFDPAMGGRPARRFIEKIIIKPLARNMLEDEFEQVAKDNKEITLDLNKAGNVCFKGKNKKILGVLENTNELVAEFEAAKFTTKKVSSLKM